MDYAAGGAGTSISADVRAWALEHGTDKRLRIVLSGYAGEHDALEACGWRVESWKTKGGYAAGGEGNANQKRERLWLSPHCLGDEALHARRFRPQVQRQALLAQLTIGGVMIVPVGPHVADQQLLKLTRVSEDEVRKETLAPVRFVPLVGE